MAIQKNALLGAATTVDQQLRIIPDSDGVQPDLYAAVAAAPLLKRGTPLAFNPSTRRWQVWSGALAAAGQDEIQSFDLTAGVAPTGGTFTLSFSGQTTSALAYNIATSALDTAIQALSNVTAVVVAGAATANVGAVTVEFTNPSGNVPVLTLDTALLTGGSGYPTAASVTQAFSPGTASDEISGIVWPNEVQLHATNDVLDQILLQGAVESTDVVLPTGEVQADLDEALRDPAVRQRGLKILSLPEVH